MTDLHTSKIKSIDTETVHVNHRGNWILVNIIADDGTTGIGEASHGRDDERITELGERLRTLTDFERLLKHGQVDYILPDVKHVGGCWV